MPAQSFNRSRSSAPPACDQVSSGVIPVYRATVQALLLESLTALLDAYDVQVLAAEEVPEGCPAGTRNLARIQFVNEDTGREGALLIGVPQSVILAMQPTASQIPCLDWVGELANQFLGRFKNKLLGRGIRLAMSTPELCPHTAIPAEQIGNGALWFRAQTTLDDVVAAARGLPKDAELGAEVTVDMMGEGECELF